MILSIPFNEKLLTPVNAIAYIEGVAAKSAAELNPRNRNGYPATNTWFFFVRNIQNSLLWRTWMLVDCLAASLSAGFTWKSILCSGLPPLISLNPIDGKTSRKEQVIMQNRAINPSVNPSQNASEAAKRAELTTAILCQFMRLSAQQKQRALSYARQLLREEQSGGVA